MLFFTPTSIFCGSIVNVRGYKMRASTSCNICLKLMSKENKANGENRSQRPAQVVQEFMEGL